MHALRTNRRARTPEEWWELAQLLAELKIQLPTSDCYRHALEVLHISARTAQRYIRRNQGHQGRDRQTSPHIVGADDSMLFGSAYYSSRSTSLGGKSRYSKVMAGWSWPRTCYGEGRVRPSWRRAARFAAL